MDNAPVVEDVCLVLVVDGVFDVLAGVFVDDILDVVDVGIFVALVVVSGGGVTVKQDAVVCIVFVVALTDVVKDGLLDIDNMPKVDDMLNVDYMLDVNDMLDGVGVGPVVVVDGVVVHVAFVAVVMRPVSILFIDSVDIVGVSSVMFSLSINKHNTSFILR